MSTTQFAPAHPPAADEEPGAALFVWLVWNGLLIVLLVLVVSYRVNIPIGDEWDHVSLISGTEPLTTGWLWAQEVNHRIPVAKLIWLESLRFSGYDFRLLMVLNVIALGGLCAALMWTAKAIRGGTSYSDAFFPLIVLNPAQWENLLSGYQVQFVIVTALSCILLMKILFKGGADAFLRWRTTALVSLALIVLPLANSAGLLLAGTVAVWFGGLSAYRALRRTEAPDRYKGLVVLAAVLLSLATIPLYFRGYVSPDYIPPVKSVYDALRATVEFMGVSFSRGFSALFFGFVVFLLMMAGTVVSLLGWLRGSQDRIGSLGVFVFLGATGILALAVGQGRGGFGPGAGLAPRYVTLMIPALACLYFAFQKCPLPGPSRFFQIVLFALSCGALPTGIGDAFGARQALNSQFAAFESDLKGGMTAVALVERHGGFLNISWTPDQTDSAAEKIRMLHRAGIGVFQFLKDEKRGETVSTDRPPHLKAALESPAAITRAAVGAIDRVNDLENPPASTPERPFSLESGQPLTLMGWMADRNDGAAFEDIYAVTNGRQIRATRLSRPDVVNYHKNSALSLSGFSVRLAPEDIGKGVQRIDIVGSHSKDGEAYRFQNPVYVNSR